VAVVAEGNRRAYAMTTTWLPHLAANSVSLLLPDIYRLVDALSQRNEPAAPARPADQRQLLRETLEVMVRDNPRYVVYVTPLAAGYLLSSPWLNIYKGKLAEKRLAGFGLDAIPHLATAFALARLVGDTAATAAALAGASGARATWLEWCAHHQGLCSAAALALATLVWEYGEYRIHIDELARRGDAERINMQWSVADTVFDCISNAAGWLLALGLSRQTLPRFGRGIGSRLGAIRR
jgi:hypothetical protein